MIKLLDLCCKAGGCSVGYFNAANELGLEIEITGIDIEPQPNYPFKFIQADAVEYLKNNFKKFTHLHASPPCQEYSCSTTMYRNKGKIYKDNLHELRQLMYKTGLPGVVENVMQAPLRPDIILRGDVFGLKVIRSRKFELINWFMMQPILPKVKGTVKNGDFASVFGNGHYVSKKGHKQPKFKKESVNKTWQFAMGMNWNVTNRELAEAVPPAYTGYIGKEFFKLNN